MTGHATLKPPLHDRDHVLGNADAPITLVEYGDFQCPHCFRAHPITIALRQHFGDRLRFAFRNFPLAEMHPEAMHAAEAAESVREQAGEDAYWTMHHAIYTHQQDSIDALDDAHLARYAATAGADPDRVLDDLANGVYVEYVRTDFMSGVRSGVNGTPTFFINGSRYEGDWTVMGTFAAALERAATPK